MRLVHGNKQCNMQSTAGVLRCWLTRTRALQHSNASPAPRERKASGLTAAQPAAQHRGFIIYAHTEDRNMTGNLHEISETNTPRQPEPTGCCCEKRRLSEASKDQPTSRHEGINDAPIPSKETHSACVWIQHAKSLPPSACCCTVCMEPHSTHPASRLTSQPCQHWKKEGSRASANGPQKTL